MCLDFVINLSFEKCRVKNNAYECQQMIEGISTQIRKMYFTK